MIDAFPAPAAAAVSVALAVAAASTFTVVSAAPAAAATFSAAGADAAAIQGTVDALRAALGPLNGNLPANGDPAGRREINWDGVPAAFADPNPLPGDFFNGDAPGRARGIEFRPTGATTGFAVSSDPADAGAGQPATAAFGFPTGFQPFSANRLFTPVGGTSFDVVFFDPSDQTTPAAVRGFGAIFTDVEQPLGTTMEFYDADDRLLERLVVELTPNRGLAVAGVVLETGLIARVSISAGTAAFLENGSTSGPDSVALDDFFFGEPVAAIDAQAVPVPAPAALLSAAFAGLGLMRSRRRKG